jgi:L-arabinose isomerase
VLPEKMCVHCPDLTSQKVNSFMTCAAGKNVTCEANSSGGLVAASVTTWLHDFGSDFMTATTTEAVNWPVIEEANTAIQRALRNTAITTSDEVQRPANHFNHGNCEIFHLVDEPRTSPDAPNQFPRETYDQTGRFL